MSGTALHSPTRILLVEDDPTHAELIRRSFDSQNGQVRLIVTSSLQAAREAVLAEAPDLAIVDLVLPDGKGVELLTREPREPPFPVMIMTGHGDEEAAVDAIKTGALNYVVKTPETIHSMPRIVEGALREWSYVLERERAEAALQASEKRYRALYDDTPSMFFTVDGQGTIVSANRFAAEQLGYSVGELVETRFSDLCLEEEPGDVRQRLETCFAEPDALHRWEICQIRRDRSRIWVRTTARTVPDEGNRPVVLMVCEDMTEAHQLSKKLSYQASHDPLTALLNRREFEYRLENILTDARTESTEHALCYLDLDQFKVINDTCGHIAGDMLLRQIGGFLQTRIRKGDSLARLGGDEFGVLIQHCSRKDALFVAESLRQAVASFRFAWEDKTFTIGASIGVVPIDGASSSTTDLLAAADSACYAAKDQGRNRIHVYHDEDADLAKRRGEMRWVARIHKAFEEERFRLSYQPIVPIGNGSLGAHYEVLIRMIDQHDNLVGPEAFLPAAERYNLIGKLDHWVVETTFRWLESHPRHLENLHMCAINLSGHSLGSSEFLEFLTRLFWESGIPPQKICLEITETMAIANLSLASRFMEELREMGCRFALDDFGSGLSSFAYLKNLPVDYLKIDGLFVKDILDDPLDMAVVASINEIAHVMGKKTIAEFVEDLRIFEKLREMGIDYAQGFGIGPPELFTEME